MSLAQDRCICLRKVEYSESSQVLLLFGEREGLVRVIAKGAHRVTRQGASKFGGGIDLLDLGQAVFTIDPARELGILTEWKLENGHLALRRNLRALYLAQYAAELVSVLIEEHDPHPELFLGLVQALADLQTDKTEEAFLAFELNLLRQTGYLAELSLCRQCNRPLSERDAAYFSPQRGGVICRNCEGTTPDRIQVDPRLLRMVQGLVRVTRGNGGGHRLPRLTRYQTDPVNRLLAEHVEHTLGRRMRLPRFVLS